MTKEFFDRYKYKISNIDKITKILKKNKKLNKKSVMCHGVFDVVHPGHIRHLAYAKSIADVLIVSITEDKAIKKGIDRPHIPSNLRALNLAAFEMVDYVIIDKNITPIENLKKIKPDFYAKGFADAVRLARAGDVHAILRLKTIANNDPDTPNGVTATGVLEEIGGLE